ncbi:hypothetical protein VNO78_06021 [Psophocarpus tetragonolobus]|uniref:Uncharacterized protein n=1 Tax=Psophocarpus tetragonolobus TaxID=3891 RepID=A0AAN9XRA3_PSOTE
MLLTYIERLNKELKAIESEYPLTPHWRGKALNSDVSIASIHTYDSKSGTFQAHSSKGSPSQFRIHPRNITRLPKLPPQLVPFITFINLPLPKVDNLPKNAEVTMDMSYDGNYWLGSKLRVVVVVGVRREVVAMGMRVIDEVEAGEKSVEGMVAVNEGSDVGDANLNEGGE